MDKLINQLKREFKKNPKKVFLLGGLLAVCLWVCVPLVMPKEEMKPVRKTPVVAAAGVAPSTTAAAAAPSWRWQDLDRRLTEDPRMSIAVPLATTGDAAPRNPFIATADAFDLDAAFDEYLADFDAETAPEAKSAPSNARLNAIPLELSSTLVADDARTAVINGRVFRQGDILAAPSGEPLVLTVVEPRRAVVEWQGMTRELKILKPGETPKPNLAGVGKGS
jgi:hypothetical protein